MDDQDITRHNAIHYILTIYFVGTATWSLWGRPWINAAWEARSALDCPCCPNTKVIDSYIGYISCHLKHYSILIPLSHEHIWLSPSNILSVRIGILHGVHLWDNLHCIMILFSGIPWDDVWVLLCWNRTIMHVLFNL